MRSGDRVVNLARRKWGPGEVLEAKTDGKALVYFAYAGEKLLRVEFLEPATGSDADHPLLKHRRLDKPRKGLRRRTVPETIEIFRGIFPQGFQDPEYVARERDYKVAAHRRMTEVLAKEALAELLASGEYQEICKRALDVVQATNLIFPNEKMALRDGLRSPEGARRLAVGLGDLLYGDAQLDQRFNSFCNILYELEAAKWTIATYFQFLALPEHFMFLKPVVTQDAADVCNFEINYRPELNWLTYRSVLEFSRVLWKEIEILEPRDMIDIQSFIWCIAPGTYE